MSLLDTQLFKVTCGSCGNEFSQLVGGVKRDNQSTCPACGHGAKLDEAGLEQIAAAEQEVADLQAKARDIFKNLFKGDD